jgi:hypothetical protein
VGAVAVALSLVKVQRDSFFEHSRNHRRGLIARHAADEILWRSASVIDQILQKLNDRVLGQATFNH